MARVIAEVRKKLRIGRLKIEAKEAAIYGRVVCEILTRVVGMHTSGVWR